MTLLFLAAYLIYNDGIQTVIAVAAQFGSEELKFSMSQLTTTILITQFVGIFGALLFNRIAARLGCRRAVMLTLLVWSATLIYIYRGVSTASEFYAAAAVVGAVMGGSQALSRSLYSLMVPKGQEAEYFSIYEISDKGTSWLGPLLFGLALQWTGSFRIAILSLILFFVTGLLLLSRVDVRRAAREAGNEPPQRC
jgi:UMF1 family MFS transporter